MKAPTIQYKCGHTAELTAAPELALLRVAGGDPAMLAMIPSDHPAIIPDIAAQLLLERMS